MGCKVKPWKMCIGKITNSHELHSVESKYKGLIIFNASPPPPCIGLPICRTVPYLLRSQAGNLTLTTLRLEYTLTSKRQNRPESMYLTRPQAPGPSTLIPLPPVSLPAHRITNLMMYHCRKVRWILPYLMHLLVSLVLYLAPLPLNPSLRLLQL